MTVTERPATFDSATFRRALGHVPTSVAVITAHDSLGRVGMTVGSFTSISLDPPLVGFFADTGSATLARVRGAGGFCANILTENQSALCAAFASRSPDRFVGVDLLPDQASLTQNPHPAPRLAQALAWVECHIESVVDIGDHSVVVGRVHTLAVGRSERRPLVFFRGTLCHLDQRTVPNRGHWQRDHYAEWW